MEPYWDLVEEIIRESDIVLEIVDARLVELSRNKTLDQLIVKYNRPRIIVVNKSDLANKRDLELALEKLKSTVSENTEIVFTTNTNRNSTRLLLSKIRQVFYHHGKRPEYDASKPMIKRPYREASGDIVVGVVGYPNVGKSSIINSLSFKKKVKVSKKAGTTHGIHWISAADDIKLIDTPGVIPLAYEDESKLGLIAARGPEKLKDVEATAYKIIEMFIKKKQLIRILDFYQIKNLNNPELKHSQDPSEVLCEISRSRGHLKKGGLPDETRTSQLIVKDWQNGKLKL